ncbi:conserved protein, unknown function, partial [Hepatocystis sp. ex Piliocolobus tephrosceles]
CVNATYCEGCLIQKNPRDQCLNIKVLNTQNVDISIGFVDPINLINKNNLRDIPFVWDKPEFDFSQCLPDINKFKSASTELLNKGMDKVETSKHIFRLINLYIYVTKLVEDNNVDPLNISISFENINTNLIKANEELLNGKNASLICPLNVNNLKMFNLRATQSLVLYKRLYIPQSNKVTSSQNLKIEITNEKGYNVTNYFFYAKINCPITYTDIENELILTQVDQLKQEDNDKTKINANNNLNNFNLLNVNNNNNNGKSTGFTYQNKLGRFLLLIIIIYYIYIYICIF